MLGFTGAGRSSQFPYDIRRRFVFYIRFGIHVIFWFWFYGWSVRFVCWLLFSHFLTKRCRISAAFTFRVTVKHGKLEKIQNVVTLCVVYLVDVLSVVDAVVDDSAELFTTGGGFSTTLFFGGLPFGLGGGFGFGAGVFTIFAALTSSSDSVVLSGEKILFSFGSTFFDAVFCAAFAAPFLLAKFLFKFCNCCCCCFTTAGGALPPVTGGAAFALDLFDCIGFFFVSFGVRFVAAVWLLGGGPSSSLELA